MFRCKITAEIHQSRTIKKWRNSKLFKRITYHPKNMTKLDLQQQDLIMFEERLVNCVFFYLYTIFEIYHYAFSKNVFQFNDLILLELFNFYNVLVDLSQFYYCITDCCEQHWQALQCFKRINKIKDRQFIILQCNHRTLWKFIKQLKVQIKQVGYAFEFFQTFLRFLKQEVNMLNLVISISLNLCIINHSNLKYQDKERRDYSRLNFRRKVIFIFISSKAQVPLNLYNLTSFFFTCSNSTSSSFMTYYFIWFSLSFTLLSQVHYFSFFLQDFGLVSSSYFLQSISFLISAYHEVSLSFFIIQFKASYLSIFLRLSYTIQNNIIIFIHINEIYKLSQSLLLFQLELIQNKCEQFQIKKYIKDSTKMKNVLFSISNPPIKQFIHTKHNIGRIFIEEYLIKKLVSKKTQTSKYTQYEFKDFPNLIACTSETYMNLSGKAIQSFVSKNKGLFVNAIGNKSLKQIVKQHILIVHDDLEHKFGNVRIKQKGSAQGHNGIKSIIGAVGGSDFRRLHLGIDRPNSADPEVVASYVLKNFSSEELRQLKQVVFPKVFQFLRKQTIL